MATFISFARAFSFLRFLLSTTSSSSEDLSSLPESCLFFLLPNSSLLELSLSESDSSSIFCSRLLFLFSFSIFS